MKINYHTQKHVFLQLGTFPHQYLNLLLLSSVVRHLMAWLGSNRIRFMSTNSIRQLPIMSTPSSTVSKLRSEVNTQLLFPVMLSLLPTTQLLLPLTTFCSPIMTLLQFLNISLILANNLARQVHLLQSSYFLVMPPNIQKEIFLMGLLQVQTVRSLFFLNKAWEIENKVLGCPKRLRLPKFRIPPSGSRLVVLLLSEQSKSAINVALRSLMALVVLVANCWSVTTPAKQSARVATRRVNVTMSRIGVLMNLFN